MPIMNFGNKMKQNTSINRVDVSEFTDKVVEVFPNIKGVDAFSVENVHGLTKGARSNNFANAVVKNFLHFEMSRSIKHEIARFITSHVDFKGKSPYSDKIPFGIGFNKETEDLYLVGEKSTITIRNNSQGVYEMEYRKHPYDYCDESEIIEDIKENKGKAPVAYERVQKNGYDCLLITSGETTVKDYAALDGSSGYMVFASSSITTEQNPRLNRSWVIDAESKSNSFSLVYGTDKNGDFRFSDLVVLDAEKYGVDPSSPLKFRDMLDKSIEEVFGQSAVTQTNDYQEENDLEQ